MILIGYKKCTTCKGIEKMLDEKNIKYTYREIDKDVPTVKELKNGTKHRVLTLSASSTLRVLFIGT